MQRPERRVWNVAGPLSPRMSLMIGGLALSSFAIAILGGLVADGWHRVAYVSAFVLMGLGNLCLAVGSRVPDANMGRAIRALSIPCSLLMFIALAFTLLFQFGVLK